MDDTTPVLELVVHTHHVMLEFSERQNDVFQSYHSKHLVTSSAVVPSPHIDCNSDEDDCNSPWEDRDLKISYFEN